MKIVVITGRTQECCFLMAAIRGQIWRKQITRKKPISWGGQSGKYETGCSLFRSAA